MEAFGKTLKAEHVRLLSFMIAVLATGIGLARFIPVQQRMRHIESQIAEKKPLLTRKESDLSNIASRPQGSLELAVAPASSHESVDFLEEFSTLARSCGVGLKSLHEVPGKAEEISASPAPNPTASGTTGTSHPPSTLVKEVVANVTVEGPFTSILTFLSRVESADRIMAISELRIVPNGYPMLNASFALTRFVASSATAQS